MWILGKLLFGHNLAPMRPHQPQKSSILAHGCIWRPPKIIFLREYQLLIFFMHNIDVELGIAKILGQKQHLFTFYGLSNTSKNQL